MSTKHEAATTMERILAREAGYVGRYQAYVFVISMIISVVPALSANEYIFTAGRINTRCFIAECESTYQTEFAPNWIYRAIPSSGDGFDNCQRFANTTVSESVNDECPVMLFDQEATMDCEAYVYENTYTAVYDLELACEEWKRSFIGSIRTIGALLALPLAGALSDRFGRRTALTIFGFNTAWLGLLRYFANTYVGFVISILAESIFGAGGVLTCGYILITELAPAKYRVVTATMSNSFFALGQVTLGLLAWTLPYWRHLTLALYAPQLLAITYIWILPESIRWYLSKGHYEKATAALKNIAKVNGREISENSLFELKQAANMKLDIEKAAKANNEKEISLIILVFQHKPILLRCIVGPVWWMTMTFIYYGLGINAVNISGNPYMNYIAVSAIEIPGYWTSMILIQHIGRKPVLFAAYWICAAGQIAYIFMPSNQYGAALTVYLISKYAISAVVTALYLYTMELYPTRYRQSLFSFSSMLGRVGSIVAPLTPALGAMVWDELPFALFAGMALVSGLLVLLTPETRGCALPDTMQEAADLGKRVHMNKKHSTFSNNDKYYVSKL